MITVRALAGRHEYADAVQLQRMIWGWEDLDILPVRFFVVARDIGGQLLGAFDDNFMCGFCVAIPGVHPSSSNSGAPYLHSHMLGVLPEYRNAGAGRMLKMAQREDALARGFELVEWTFDPLELKNAYFNIEKLGAVIRHYLPNHYGITTSSLGGGLPTDRCLAEWHLNRPRREFTTLARIPVPAGLDRLRRTDPDEVLQIQQQVARLFQQNLASGLAVTGFERSPDSGAYLFSSWPSD
ncbi:MAG TPA: GNAT family N-acetyltransferase [Bryobacteraceae bacterium]|jgi:predicted GNAT superfamily acetyltransferase|nr:GNAT family N-acetyltransferase [Bryobacteraceae bacterium]